ncbi:hypothetical protein [Streptomyces narbonensis]
MGGERARLTALYGGLLLLAGALFTGVVYFLVKDGLYSSISVAMTTAVPAQRLQDLPPPPRPARCGHRPCPRPRRRCRRA